jgi:2-oxoacid:acceptor oxidoreductase delta subunit (pyruvate/2-ketoisovalerate family)
MKACEIPPQKETVLKRRTRRGRKSLLSAEPGFSEAEALASARQCLGLLECASCDLCQLFCPELCITREESSGLIQIDLDYCKGCGLCAAICPKKAIRMVREE